MHNPLRKQFYALTIISAVAVSICANEAPTAKFSGNGSLMFGQIVKGVSTSGNGDTLKNAWVFSPTLNLRLKADYNKNTRLRFDIHAEIFYTYELNSAILGQQFAADQKVAKDALTIDEAQAIYTIGGSDTEQFPLQIGVGIFPYKYNPQVRNLGEYLFRASAYPVYFVNWYDGPFYRMAGVRASTAPFTWFAFDALMFSEMYQLPLQDISCAGIVKFTIGKFAELGGGVDLSRIISIHESYTTPPYTSNTDKSAYSKDSIGVDPISGQPILDTKCYTFASTKCAVRASIDPKAFLPWRYFGPEDLKIYGECAILGLHNYSTHNVYQPAFYDTLSQRSPFMIGFNFPTFRILDVLAIEYEHLKTPYLPSSYEVFNNGIPVPVTAAEKFLTLSDNRWSIYVKRSLGAFSFLCQIAQDHYIANNNNLWAQERADAMPEKGNWWWSCKVAYGF
jgi:hypothetical protein